ncbi:MAG: helix-turn-helix domain-containing protein [Gammaproteobacteria bacterium]|nr:helix-turn-helix domain-containing protein [Gammaproteobacteria bacterium]
MGKKPALTPDQRAALVLRMLSKEEPAAQIAPRAGISEQTLYRWREEFFSARKLALAGRGAEHDQVKEIGRLKSAVAQGADGDHTIHQPQ